MELSISSLKQQENMFGARLESQYSSNSCCLEQWRGRFWEEVKVFRALCSDKWFLKQGLLNSSDSSDSLERLQHLLGPLIYGIMTVLFDSRMGILSISLLIVAGAILLRKVDVEDGIAVAKAEDERNRSGAEE